MANSTKKEKLKAEDKEDEEKCTSKASPEDEKPKEEKSVDKPEDKPKEDVEKASEDEDTSDLNDEEKAAYIKLKSRVKKRAVKAAGAGESPTDVKPNSGENTISPNTSTPSAPQNVFVPQSSVTVAREHNTPMGKSVNPDLMKSPLYNGISEQIEATRLSLDSKMAAVEKSYNARLDNLQKELAKTEEVLKKFYSQSFYKAAAENVSPEGTQHETIAKQLEAGKIRFSL